MPTPTSSSIRARRCASASSRSRSGWSSCSPAGSLAAIERGLPTELTPGRDYGVQLQGEFADGALSYAVGVFNGTADGRDGVSSNPDNEFEYAGRVFWEPFKDDANAWSGLGFGIAASVGDKSGSGDNVLPRYRTPGQVQVLQLRQRCRRRRPASPLVAAGATTTAGRSA